MRDDLEGTVLAERYELGPVIGVGGMGVVHGATDLRLQRDVAIKILRSDLAADNDARRRFEDEAVMAGRLTHNSAVTVFDAGEDGSLAFLVMERLSGETLAHEMATGPLRPERVKAIAVDLLGALQAAHGLGIVHRDVKPANVLLTNDGSPKLADFGIAKSAEGSTQTSTGLLLGTAPYMAPEQLAGDPADAFTDLYSLGVILYEALTGERPFPGDSPMAIAHSMQSGTPMPLGTRLPDLDPMLADTIDDLLSRDKTIRSRSATQLLGSVEPASPNGASTQRFQRPPISDTQLDYEPTAIHQAPAVDGDSPEYGVNTSRRRTATAAALICGALVVLGGVSSIAWHRIATIVPDVSTSTTINAEPLPKSLSDALEQLKSSVK